MKSEINALILKVQGMKEIGEIIRMESDAMEPEGRKRKVQRTAPQQSLLMLQRRRRAP
jgi:hypothetical protein